MMVPLTIHADLARHLVEGGALKQPWFGPEHPALEERALALLAGRRARVLEIGYQAGGFAVPIILAMARTPGFRYHGIDSLVYPNAAVPEAVSQYLRDRGVPPDIYDFERIDAFDFLMTCREQFDLVLIDHVKGLYLRELKALLVRRLVADRGVILLHDVLDKAASAWVSCARLVARLGASAEIDEDVPSGLALVWPGDRLALISSTSARIDIGARWGVRLARRFLRGRG